MKFDTRAKFPRLQFLAKKRENDKRFLNDDHTLNDAAIRRMEFNRDRNAQR